MFLNPVQFIYPMRIQLNLLFAVVGQVMVISRHDRLEIIPFILEKQAIQ
jgi:hypothetical protein